VTGNGLGEKNARCGSKKGTKQVLGSKGSRIKYITLGSETGRSFGGEKGERRTRRKGSSGRGGVKLRPIRGYGAQGQVS